MWLQCIVMINTAVTKDGYINIYLQMISDLGQLMTANILYDFYGLDWFQHVCEDEIGKKD